MSRLARFRSAVRAQLRATAVQVRTAASNPPVRGLQIAWGTNQAAEWAYFTALEVFAFRVGGAFAVGLVGVLSELPSALVGPVTSVLGQRIRRERLLFVLAAVRSAELAAAAVAYSRGAPPGFFYGLLGLDSVLSSAVFPAQQGLLRRLVRTRRELSTSAAVTALVETIGGGLGPLAGGLLLATTNLGVVYGFSAGLLLSSGIMFLGAVWGRKLGPPMADTDYMELAARAPSPLGPRPLSAAHPLVEATGSGEEPAVGAPAPGGDAIPTGAPVPPTGVPPPAGTPPNQADPDDDEEDEEDEEGWLISDFVEGIRAIWGRRDVLILLSMFAMDGFLEGMLDVAIIVLALETLGIGPAGVGGLSVVETIGGLAGGLVALNVVGVRRLATRWGMLGFVDGFPPALLAAFPNLGVTIGLLVIWEGIDTIDEGIGLELMSRVVPGELMPQVVGLEDSVETLSIAVGSILGPVLIVLTGIRGTLLAIAILGPLLTILVFPWLRRLDQHMDAGPTEPGVAASPS